MERGKSLHDAVCKGNQNAVRRLLSNKEGPSVNDVLTEEKWTSLHVAAREGHADIVRLLVELGAKVNSRAVDGRSAACVAAYLGHANVISALAELGADLNLPDINGQHPFLHAAKAGHPSILELLVGLGVDYRKRESTYRGAYYLAVSENAPRAVETIHYLHKLGVDVNQISLDEGQRNAVCLAVQAGNMTLLRTLNEVGADLSIRSCDTSHSAMELAIIRGDIEMVRALHSWGVDIDAWTRDVDIGCTPVCMAARRNQVGALRVLHELGANMDQQSSHGRNIDELAIKKRATPCVRYLVKAGINLKEMLWERNPSDGWSDPTKKLSGVALLLSELAADAEDCAGAKRAGEQAESRQKRGCTAFALVQLMSATHVGVDPQFWTKSEAARHGKGKLAVTNNRKAAFETVLRQALRSLRDKEDGKPTAGPLPVTMTIFYISYKSRSALMKLSAAAYTSAAGPNGVPSDPLAPLQLLQLFHSPGPLIAVLCLRNTCRCCADERRFPLLTGKGKGRGQAVGALQAGLIESFLGGDMAYFVPTADLRAALTIYEETFGSSYIRKKLRGI